MLNPKAIAKFQTLYLKEYGIKLSKDQATELGTQLVKLVKTVYGKDVPKKWIPKIDRNKIKD